jgi:hypothetical protein
MDPNQVSAAAHGDTEAGRLAEELAALLRKAQGQGLAEGERQEVYDAITRVLQSLKNVNGGPKGLLLFCFSLFSLVWWCC